MEKHGGFFGFFLENNLMPKSYDSYQDTLFLQVSVFTRQHNSQGESLRQFDD